jgi:hypothetical protein
VEVIEELFLFSLKILELLQSHFILPFDVLEHKVMLHDLSLGVFELLHLLIVQLLLNAESLNLFTCFMEWHNYLFIGFFLVHLVLLFESVFFLSISKLIFKLFDDVKIGVGDLLIVVLNVIVLLCMLRGKLFDSDVLFIFYLLNKPFAFSFHLFSQEKHLVFVFKLDLIGYSFIFLPYLGCLLVLFSCQGI